MQDEEGAFIGCSCWLVEAYVFQGEVDVATGKLKALLEKLGNNFGILNEQMDVEDGSALGTSRRGSVIWHCFMPYSRLRRIHDGCGLQNVGVVATALFTSLIASRSDHACAKKRLTATVSS